MGEARRPAVRDGNLPPVKSCESQSSRLSEAAEELEAIRQRGPL